MIYLDHAASTPMHSDALAILQETLKKEFANPSSGHCWGKRLLKECEHIEHFFLETLGTKPNEHNAFLFTGSASESNNMAILGEGILAQKTNGNVIYFAGDHPSLVKPVEKIITDNGLEARPIAVSVMGRISEERILQLIDSNTLLVALTHVNSVSGQTLDLGYLIPEIKKINKRCHIHIDGAQSFGKIPFAVSYRQHTIDSATLSAHKMGGPKGLGGLYIKDRAKYAPIIHGGAQQHKLRSGTLHYPFIKSWWAATAAVQDQLEDFKNRGKKIQKYLIEELASSKTSLLTPFFWEDVTSPFVTTVISPHIPSDVLMRHLEMKSIFVSSSSACSSKNKGPSPTFSAHGIPLHYHKNVLRISSSPNTSIAEIKEFANNIKIILGDLEKIIGHTSSRHLGNFVA